jgi:hypothetical protein
MSAWDEDSIDEEEEGSFEFDDKGSGFNATHFAEPSAERGWDCFPRLFLDTTKQEASAAPAALLCSPAGKSDPSETVCRMSRSLCQAVVPTPSTRSRRLVCTAWTLPRWPMSPS